MQAQSPKALSQKPKLSAATEKQNPLCKLEQVQYLDTYILDICVMLDDLL